MKDGEHVTIEIPEKGLRFNPLLVVIALLLVAFITTYFVFLIDPSLNNTTDHLSLLPTQVFFTFFCPFYLFTGAAFYCLTKGLVWKLQYDNSNDNWTCIIYTKRLPLEFKTNDIQMVWINWKTHVFLKSGQRVTFKNSPDMFQLLIDKSIPRTWGMASRTSNKDAFEKDIEGAEGGWFFKAIYLNDE
ncbi:hypothetical protein [Desulfoluna butyratoxydans]|uniref:Tmem70 family n=1 Tax=Desulfoluna butyratoxydans TaxID=231438 RepID=A0A4U8YG93_9BACT|nr:hypothetical protein [Desulfoluna butyratoxydans]VFQ42421.1 tmem70 family [Desulfoluna butyratoxydans]